MVINCGHSQNSEHVTDGDKQILVNISFKHLVFVIFSVILAWLLSIWTVGLQQWVSVSWYIVSHTCEA